MANQGGFQFRWWQVPAMAAVLIIMDGGGQLVREYTGEAQPIVINLPDSQKEMQAKAAEDIADIREQLGRLSINVASIYSKLDEISDAETEHEQAVAELRIRFTELIGKIDESGL